MFGRKLFWLLVGTIGFVIGLEVAGRLVHGPEIISLMAGVIIGLIFAMLAIFVESVAIGVAGFLGGGYALLSLAAMMGLDRIVPPLVAFFVGGVLGVILIVALLDWALITISALAGASMIVSGLALRQGTVQLVYAGLVLGGVLIQGFALRRERGTPRASTAQRPAEDILWTAGAQAARLAALRCPNLRTVAPEKMGRLSARERQRWERKPHSQTR